MMKELRMSVRTRITGGIFILFLLSGLMSVHAQTIDVVGAKGNVGEITIILKFTEPVDYRSFTLGNPPRLVLDIPGATLKEPKTIEMNNEIVETIRYLQYQPDTVRIVVNLTQPAESRVRKAGKKLLLYFSLPPEVKARLQVEARAKAKAEREKKKKLVAEERARVAQEKEKARRLALERKSELKVKEEAKRKLDAEKRAREKEEEAWRKSEERAKQLLGQRVRKETKLQSKEAISKSKLAAEVSRREEKGREKKAEDYLRQGKKYCRAGQFDEAIGKFEAVLTLDPGNQEVLNYISLAEKSRDEKRRLQDTKQRKKEKETKLVQYLDKGQEYYTQGFFTEAIEEWNKIIPLTVPNDSRRRVAKKLIHRAKLAKIEMERKDLAGKREIEREKYLLTADKDWLPSEKKKEMGQVVGPVKSEVEDTEAKKRLRERAMRPISIDFNEANLRDVLRYLAKIGEINIVLDETVFSKGGEVSGEVSGEMGGKIGENIGENIISPLVTIHLKEIPLIEALDIILRAKGLSYRLEQNIIWVTTAERIAAEEMVTKIYYLSSGISGITKFEKPAGLEEETE